MSRRQVKSSDKENRLWTKRLSDEGCPENLIDYEAALGPHLEFIPGPVPPRRVFIRDLLWHGSGRYRHNPSTDYVLCSRCLSLRQHSLFLWFIRRLLLVRIKPLRMTGS
ncbi:hypothetical protein BDV35DRAFT_385733 [Aspergillus flavus]|uniref:Uncharacterized protein n=1 Tax=Aspergillus flavus TaxID=5059 RepID=A0A5N6GDU5_ASPFL|nr:hypothetical protein BDV35DRAFT_385733 [Aspergillus flavus]